MNNEQKTLMNMIQTLTKLRANSIDKEKALEQFVYFLDEFIRRENTV